MEKKLAMHLISCSISALFIIVIIGCGQNETEKRAEAPKPAAAPDSNGWITLFDGTDFDAWDMDKAEGWVIENGIMALSNGGSIWSKQRFGDFELDLDFKVSAECNSGIFFRTGSLKDPVQTGIEMQVFDSAGKPNPDKHDSGAMYDLLEPGTNAMKPAGEWNHVTITCTGSLITVIMNDTKIIDMDAERWTTPHLNPDGTENKFNAALKDFPREGHIGFQDHGHPVWYRNVKIRKI